MHLPYKSYSIGFCQFRCFLNINKAKDDILFLFIHVSIIHLSMYILSVDVSKYKFDVKYGILISFVAIFKKKFMATTEMDWCEKVVYWKMMCFDHSFHLSLLNDQIIFWFDGKRWAEKPHHSRPALNRYAWHVKMLVSEMICRCWLLFHHL